jgi:poly-gamma-glutamate capsule biosynthesis protein CapA/YwtB (metallophosphatase superfamily)
MLAVLVLVSAACLSACTRTVTSSGTPSILPTSAARHGVDPTAIPHASSSSPPARPGGTFTFSFAGDVNFAERTAARLADDPATAFGVAATQLRRADLTMVNLETAIAVGGRPEIKSFTFEAPPSAFTALRAAGVDVATMANNHGADYGSVGLRQTLTAIATSHFPVVGIGQNAAAAYAPFTTTVNGVRVAVVAASQVRDETLAHFTAGANSPGIANAYSDRLVEAVRAAKAAGFVVIAYIHWGTEYTTCPNADQRTLQAALAAAGASAVIGTHAHELQGAGWRPDGVYVGYGLSNYLWWRSFGNTQDDNGVLTLRFTGARVTGASFAPAHLDSTGVPVPAVGEQAARIDAEWEQDRECAGLLSQPPG